MPPRIEDPVVVVTGASSGIARATAIAFAERGARVVLAARHPGTLEEAARECERAGGKALPVPTDVSDQAAVERLARRAAETFGRIDVWVNAAAVIAYGEFEKTPADAYRHVIETNLFGQIHGARAVLPYFRRQGHGVLVNVASVWGSVTSPYVSSYVVSKFGVRAFSESLQEGLRLEKETRDIHVCTILPQSVDTPIFSHAGNWTGRKTRPVPPVADPGRVVAAIVKSAEHPRRQRTVGAFGRLLEFGHAAVPGFYSRLVPAAMNLGALSWTEEASDSPGNIFQPMPELNRVSGNWRENRPAITITAGAVIAGGAAVVALLRSRRRGAARCG